MSVEDVYALLAPAAKVAVDAAREHRSKLAAVLALKQLTAKVKSANASDLGITVLREVGGIVRVGMFDIPRIDVKIMPAPKSEWTNRSTRLRRAQPFNCEIPLPFFITICKYAFVDSHRVCSL